MMIYFFWRRSFLVFRCSFKIGTHSYLIFHSLLETGISQWYSTGLRTGCSEVRVPAKVGNFSFHHAVQTGSGTHPVTYAMGTRGSFSWDKGART
jgi:hypothetical protein